MVLFVTDGDNPIGFDNIGLTVIRNLRQFTALDDDASGWILLLARVDQLAEALRLQGWQWRTRARYASIR